MGVKHEESDDVQLTKILATLFLTVVAIAFVWWTILNVSTEVVHAMWAAGILLTIGLLSIHIVGNGGISIS